MFFFLLLDYLRSFMSQKLAYFTGKQRRDFVRLKIFSSDIRRSMTLWIMTVTGLRNCPQIRIETSTINARFNGVRHAS